MDSAISPARLGASARAPRFGSTGASIFPHSLGIFYQALTQYLGFPHYGDEYKVMGLAPYGAPCVHGGDAPDRALAARRRASSSICAIFRHHRERIAYQWNDGAPKFGDLFSPRSRNCWDRARKPDDPLEDRHRDIARSVQAMYEEAFFHLLKRCSSAPASTDLALAGGCAMNSVANGKVRRKTPFRRVYVQSAAGDAGGAIGAAFAVWHRLGGARSLRHGPRLLGAAVQRGRDRCASR